jgi:hypothetical protein
MLKIIQYNFISLKRIKIARYQFAPEYIALFILVGLFTIAFIGLSSESPIKYYDFNILNYNKLAFFYLLAPIFIDIFMFKYVGSNYQYFKLLYPFKLSKIIFIDLLLELFSFKIAFIVFFVLAYIPFCLTYNLKITGVIPVFGFLLIICMYINSCLIIRVIKDVMKNKAYDFHKNFLKLFFVVVFVLLTVNENINFINFNSYITIFWFLSFAILSIIVLVILLYLINIKYDKI